MNIPRFTPIDTSIVRRMMNYNKAPVENISSVIKNIVKEETGIDPTLYRHYRGEKLVEARFLFMVMMVNFTKDKYRDIAGMLGKDHATVSHAIKTTCNMCDTDRDYKAKFERIELKITAKGYKKIKNNQL
jgi:chromosomal replication initiation ATPase DnaA